MRFAYAHNEPPDFIGCPKHSSSLTDCKRPGFLSTIYDIIAGQIDKTAEYIQFPQWYDAEIIVQLLENGTLTMTDPYLYLDSALFAKFRPILPCIYYAKFAILANPHNSLKPIFFLDIVSKKVVLLLLITVFIIIMILGAARRNQQLRLQQSIFSRNNNMNRFHTFLNLSGKTVMSGQTILYSQNSGNASNKPGTVIEMEDKFYQNKIFKVHRQSLSFKKLMNKFSRVLGPWYNFHFQRRIMYTYAPSLTIAIVLLTWSVFSFASNSLFKSKTVQHAAKSQNNILKHYDRADIAKAIESGYDVVRWHYEDQVVEWFQENSYIKDSLNSARRFLRPAKLMEYMSNNKGTIFIGMDIQDIIELRGHNCDLIAVEMEDSSTHITTFLTRRDLASATKLEEIVSTMIESGIWKHLERIYGVVSDVHDDVVKCAPSKYENVTFKFVATMMFQFTILFGIAGVVLYLEIVTGQQ